MYFSVSSGQLSGAASRHLLVAVGFNPAEGGSAGMTGGNGQSSDTATAQQQFGFGDGHQAI